MDSGKEREELSLLAAPTFQSSALLFLSDSNLRLFDLVLALKPASTPDHPSQENRDG